MNALVASTLAGQGLSERSLRELALEVAIAPSMRYIMLDIGMEEKVKTQYLRMFLHARDPTYCGRPYVLILI